LRRAATFRRRTHVDVNVYVGEVPAAAFESSSYDIRKDFEKRLLEEPADLSPPWYSSCIRVHVLISDGVTV
jgi:hypothetical protein